jgi:hypothetical protein
MQCSQAGCSSVPVTCSQLQSVLGLWGMLHSIHQPVSNVRFWTWPIPPACPTLQCAAWLLLALLCDSMMQHRQPERTCTRWLGTRQLLSSMSESPQITITSLEYQTDRRFCVQPLCHGAQPPIVFLLTKLGRCQTCSCAPWSQFAVARAHIQGMRAHALARTLTA